MEEFSPQILENMISFSKNIVRTKNKSDFHLHMSRNFVFFLFIFCFNGGIFFITIYFYFLFNPSYCTTFCESKIPIYLYSRYSIYVCSIILLNIEYVSTLCHSEPQLRLDVTPALNFD